MGQMPDSFKPIDMPESFQPIGVSIPELTLKPEQFQPQTIPAIQQVQAEEPGLLERAASGIKSYYNESPRLQRFLTGYSEEDKKRMLEKGIKPVESDVIKIPGVESLTRNLEHKIDPTDSPFYTGVRPLLAGGVKLLGDTLAAGFDPRTAGIKRGAFPELEKPKIPEVKPPRTLDIEVPKVNVEQLQQDLPLQSSTELVKPAEQLAAKPDFILPESTVKLRNALKESVPLNKQQRELYRVERAEKFGKAEDVKVESEADLPKFNAAFKGPHTKVDITPLRESLEQTDIDSLIKQIHNSPLSVTEKKNASDGLEGLLEGRVPTNYDIQQLGKVFGEDIFSTMPRPMTLRRFTVGMGQNFKGLKSAGDFGSPLRQGANYVGRESWFKSILPMMKGYGSQRIFDEKMAFIKNDPFFETARDKMKIAFTDLANNREENAVGKIVGNLPLVKNSNRAATLFSNNMRLLEAKKQYDTWKSAYETGMKLAKSPEEIAAAKALNPDNPYIAAKLGERINTATGRGSLGKAEAISEDLNAIAFSPHLMSSRIRSINRVLNLVMYNNYNRLEVKDALKQLVSLATAGASSALSTKMIYDAMGKHSTIETSPDSTDFMKVKIGANTRYDPWGGYQQYFVPLFKVAMGTYTPTSGNKQRDLNKGAFAPGGFGTLTRSFLENKLSPLGALADVAINRSEMGGRAVNLTSLNPAENTLTRVLANPIILQDFYEILNEDPYLLPMLVPDMFGQSVQVYDQRKGR